MFNLFKFVGLRHLKLKPLRTILTVLGVSFGVALFIAIEIINRSTIASFKESIDAVAGQSQLTVMSGETGFPEDREAIVAKIPGVKFAAPMVETRAYFAGPNKSTQSLIILGVDLLREQNFRTYKTTDEQVIEDPLTFLNQPDSIIITKSFADEHGLEMDSTFEIASSTGKKKMTVRGILTPEGPAKAYGGSLGIMDIDGARMTFGKEGKLDRLDIVAADNVNIDELGKKIESTLGPGYRALRPEGQSQERERLVHGYQVMLSFFSTLALLVGLFLVTNSVTISIAERRREIGTLRALGATRFGVVFLFVLEATVMGFIGAAIGVWLGKVLSVGLMDSVTHSLSTQYLTVIKATKTVFGVDEIIKGLLLGAGASFVAALLPASKTTGISPLEAMARHESLVTGKKEKLFGYTLYLGIAMLVFLSISSYWKWLGQSTFVELINQISGVAGPALAGPGLVAILIYFIQKIAGRRSGTITRIAYDNLLRNPRRTGSNVTTLMIGLVLVIMIASLNISFKTTIINWFDRVLRPDLLISAQGKLVTYQVQPIQESLGAEIEKVPGVDMGPKRGAYALRFIHFLYEGKQLGLKAYDEPNPIDEYRLFDVQDGDHRVVGPKLFNSTEPTIFVSENFVMHFHKKTGDTVEIQTPTGLGRFKVIGVIVDFASPEGIVYMNREVYKKFWLDPLVDTFGVVVKPGFTADQVRKSIDETLGKERNLMVISNKEIKAQIGRSVDESFAYTRAIEFAALLVALMGLFNTFLISVMERTRELGMLRAVGMSQKQVRSLIIKEALVQGTLGAFVSIVLGGWIAFLWVRTSLSKILGWIIHFYFPWNAIITTAFIGLAVTLIAGLYPAFRAAKLNIREALDYE